MTTRTAPAEGPPIGQHEPVFTFRYVRANDPLAKPLLDDLEREYDTRYGEEVFGEPASVEINRYPVEAFAEPDGAFLLLLEDGAPVSGARSSVSTSTPPNSSGCGPAATAAAAASRVSCSPNSSTRPGVSAIAACILPPAPASPRPSRYTAGTGTPRSST